MAGRYKLGHSYMGPPTRFYVSIDTENAWRGWQAAETAAVRACAAICEESLSPYSDIRAIYPEAFAEEQ